VPVRVAFYSKDWKAFGTRSELQAEISEITGIDIDCLKGKGAQSASVAARIFWASKRETTGVEDTAYCLMGLFDVNMPLLYGEGYKAFIRLQEEVMKSSEDHSLFAWRVNGVYQPQSMGFVTGLFSCITKLVHQLWENCPNQKECHKYSVCRQQSRLAYWSWLWYLARWQPNSPLLCSIALISTRRERSFRTYDATSRHWRAV
jgi:hypothetical protein